jgi:hypothetical protein
MVLKKKLALPPTGVTLSNMSKRPTLSPGSITMVVRFTPLMFKPLGAPTILGLSLPVVEGPVISPIDQE